MQIGRFDSEKFDARKLMPEVKIAVAVSFLLYAAAHVWITYGQKLGEYLR